MPLNTIITSMLTRLESITLPAGVSIFYSNVEDDLPAGNFIKPDFLPSDTTPVDLVHTNRETGVMQVSIFVRKGQGEVIAANIAKAILDGFPRNLKLNGVRIDAPGSIGASFFDGNWQITPVTVQYQHIE